MQLLFTREEIVVLATVLEESERELRDPVVSGAEAEVVRRRKHARVEGLLESMSSTHPEFDADQLDDLAEALRDRKEKRAAELAAATDTSSKITSEQRFRTLQQILDKVTEACAMA